jgi:hypothetical protein
MYIRLVLGLFLIAGLVYGEVNTTQDMSKLGNTKVETCFF